MWNAELYNRFGKQRIQPSMDLVNRIVIEDCTRILDVGCGSGMSTLCIRSKFPKAEIVGVDLSESMLEKATQLMEDVQWLQRDCSKKLEDLGKFDLIFSNAFLQWLDDQESFIRNIKSLLSDKGILAMQIPNCEEMEIAKIIKQVVTAYDYEHTLFTDIKANYFNYTANEYYDMFTRYYTDVEMWQTNYYHQMKDYEEIIQFISSTALMPYLECLSAEQTDEFLGLLKKEMANYYKVSENGKVLFPFHRLFFIVKA